LTHPVHTYIQIYIAPKIVRTNLTRYLYLVVRWTGEGMRSAGHNRHVSFILSSGDVCAGASTTSSTGRQSLEGISAPSNDRFLSFISAANFFRYWNELPAYYAEPGSMKLYGVRLSVRLFIRLSVCLSVQFARCCGVRRVCYCRPGW